MKWVKYFFIFLFLLSCDPKNLDGERREPRERTELEDSSDDDSLSDKESSRNSESRTRKKTAELRRLKNSENQPLISSSLEKRYSGFASLEDYGGEKCSESSSCESLCDGIFSSKYRSKCYRSPRDFVEDVEEGLFALINISKVESVRVSPAFIKGILDIDEEILLNLIEDRMSEGGLKSFLAWVAVNEDISQVFDKEDRSHEILKAAFEKLGEFQKSSRGRRIETALNTGLIAVEDTFLSLSVDEDNEYGFKSAYTLLKRACRGKDCKLDVLCARESRASSRSRVFGSSRGIQCRTSTRPDRRAGSSGTCYAHGARVWSFLDELIEDDEINDHDFEDSPITVLSCNTFCGSEDSRNTKCRLVL